MKAKCVDASQSWMLETGKEYFVLPNGPKAFYVSKFDKLPENHFGSFSKDRFEVLELADSPPAEPEEEDLHICEDPDTTYYRAVVDTSDPWWSNGKEYIISSRNDYGYYNVHRLQDGFIIATLLNERFRIIEPCESPEKEITKAAPKDEPAAKQYKIKEQLPQFEQLTLF